MLVNKDSYQIHNDPQVYLPLTAHNWQKWNSIFLICPRHEIYKVERWSKQFQLYFKNYTFLWKCEIWGDFVKNWYFVNNCLIKVNSNLKIPLHICDTYNCDYLPHTIFYFYLIDWQLNADFPSQFCVFYLKINYRLLKDGFLKKILLKRAKTRRLFIAKL